MRLLLRAPARSFFSFLKSPAVAAAPSPPPPPPLPAPPPLDGHRAFGANELRFATGMAGAPSPFSHSTNPGLRVLPELVSPLEAEALLREVDAHLLPRFGLRGEHAGDAVRVQGLPAEDYAALVLPRVNTARVTGRPESARQTLAPWGYADAFRAEALPTALRALVDRLQVAPGFALGAPRDVTVNVREQAFFKLDPHVDPRADGDTVFIVSVGPSPTVLTFSPPSAPRRTPEEVSLRSWSDADVDVLSLPRSAVAFSGSARWVWRHATRVGVMASSSSSSTGIACDWFGSTKRLLPRQPGRRVSIVVAFGAPPGVASTREASLEAWRRMQEGAGRAET
jgi:hypothetical protein